MCSLCPSSSHVNPPFPSFSHDVIPRTWRSLFPCLHLHRRISQEDASLPQASPQHSQCWSRSRCHPRNLWRVSLRGNVLNIKRTSDFHTGRILGSTRRSRCYRYDAKQRGTEFQIRLDLSLWVFIKMNFNALS